MPSLAEITGIRGDAAIAAGTSPGANLAQLAPANTLISVLDSAAAAQADANRYAMDMYQKNVKDFYANFDNIDVNGLMEKDYPVITSQWAKLANDMAENYDVIANPWKDQQRYADLKNREAVLRGQIAQSKQDVGLRTMYQQYLGTHKDFETPQNRAKLKDFSGLGLGQRDPALLLNPQPKFDVSQEAIAKAANTAAQQKLTTEVAKNPWLSKVERTQFLKSAYDEAVEALVSGEDEYGRTRMQAVGDAFESMPAPVKQQYTNATGQPDLLNFAKEALYGPLRNQDSTVQTLDANPFSQIAAQGAETRRNMRLAAELNKEDLQATVTQLVARQRNIFEQADLPGAQKEEIDVRGIITKPKQYQDWDIKKLFAPKEDETEVRRKVEGVKLSLDPWLVNAYSIPGAKVKTYDPETGKEISQDTYQRPSAAWITTEKDPNARKVVVRYKDPDTDEERDIIYPYAENLQVLDNIYGPKDALKVGNAKTKVLKDIFGEVSPSFEKIKSNKLFSNPNAAAPNLQETTDLPYTPFGGIRGPVATDKPQVAPQNPTVGEFDFNATRRKQKK